MRKSSRFLALLFLMALGAASALGGLGGGTASTGQLTCGSGAFRHTTTDCWTQEDSACNSDDEYALEADQNCDGIFWVYNFGFNLQTDAIVDSILVYVEGYGAAGQTNRRRFDCWITLDSGNTASADNVAANQLDQSDSTLAIWPTDHLWGYTLITGSQMNSRGFGVGLDKINNFIDAIYIDEVEVLVYYTYNFSKNAMIRNKRLGS